LAITKVFTNPFNANATLTIIGTADNGITVNDGAYIPGNATTGGFVQTVGTVGPSGQTTVKLYNTDTPYTWVNLTLNYNIL